LLGGPYLIHLANNNFHFTNDTWCSGVHARGHPIREGIASDAPRDREMATQSLCKLARQAGYFLLLHVGPHFILSPSIFRCHPSSQIDQFPTELIIRYSVFLYSLINLLAALRVLSSTEVWQAVLTFILQYVPMFTLTPRFVLSIRELHARDIQARCGGEIDTGFGLSSHGRNTGGTVVMFASLNGGLEDVEEIPIEARTTQLE